MEASGSARERERDPNRPALCRPRTFRSAERRAVIVLLSLLLFAPAILSRWPTPGIFRNWISDSDRFNCKMETVLVRRSRYEPAELGN